VGSKLHACRQGVGVCCEFYCWAGHKRSPSGLNGPRTSNVMFFFHLTAMHRSGNIVPEILGTRSRSVRNI
jgi:hypothetical protein